MIMCDKASDPAEGIADNVVNQWWAGLQGPGMGGNCPKGS